MRKSFSLLLPLLCLFFAFAAHANTIEVEGPQDSLLGPPEDFTVNHCTLRKAIINANTDTAVYPQCAAGSGLDTIVFISPMTVTFSAAYAGINEEAGLTGDLDITDSLIIDGGGSTIDAASLDRIFDINPTGSNNAITVTLMNLNLRNGHGQGAGGAIRQNGGTLTLNNVTISDSFVFEGDGGAIASLNNTSVPLLLMTNCTITGNHAAFHAGAMTLEGDTTITSCTIAGNHSDTGLSGGLRNTGNCSLRNTIVASNTNSSPPDFIPNLDGAYVSNGYNVIGDLGTQAGNPLMGATASDHFGVSNAQLNLAALANNGGPVLTRALNTGSVAIDKGHSSGSSTDARGFTRPCDLSSVSNAPGGDGGDVGAFEVQGACAASNTNPIANLDFATIAEDSGTTAINVLANDTDAEGNTLTITGVTQGANGSVAITGGGTGLTYTPNANFNGNDSFTYTISDGNGGTATGTVDVTVTPVNDDPVAVNDSAIVNEDTSNNVVNVLTNDSDVDGDSLTVTTVGSASHGSVTHSASSVSYTPAHDYFGSDSFTYTIADGHGGFATATVFVTVNNVNDPPVANADSYSVNQDITLTVPAPGVLGNDTDVDGDTLHAALVANASHGSVTLNANGSFTYIPNAHFSGFDTFTYKANDSHVDSNVATVTIHVLDTQPPAITASVATNLLWPVNHDLVNVGFTFNATDNGGGAITTQLDVFSDEDDVTSANGDQSPDAKDIAAGTLRLRAERDATSDGRVYLIRVRATDASSNTSQSCVTVVVPKSLSASDLASVNAQAAAARAACTATFVVGDGPVVGPKQ